MPVALFFADGPKGLVVECGSQALHLFGHLSATHHHQTLKRVLMDALHRRASSPSPAALDPAKNPETRKTNCGGGWRRSCCPGPASAGRKEVRCREGGTWSIHADVWRQ